MITYNINLCGGKNVWRIRQACAKKGYPIANANKWLGQLKRDKVIEI